MDSVSSPKEAKQQVYAEQVALLYGYAPLAYTVTLINGLILIFIQRHEIPIPTLLVWFACLILATAGRAILVFCYRRANPPAEEARRWEQRYLLGAALATALFFVLSRERSEAASCPPIAAPPALVAVLQEFGQAPGVEVSSGQLGQVFA